jgi:hypothetical protein
MPPLHTLEHDGDTAYLSNDAFPNLSDFEDTTDFDGVSVYVRDWTDITRERERIGSGLSGTAAFDSILNYMAEKAGISNTNTILQNKQPPYPFVKGRIDFEVFRERGHDEKLIEVDWSGAKFDAKDVTSYLEGTRRGVTDI